MTLTQHLLESPESKLFPSPGSQVPMKMVVTMGTSGHFVLCQNKSELSSF